MNLVLPGKFLPANDASGVLVIVPAFNESAIIADIVRQLEEAEIGDVLVIDDGSTDGTASVASAAGAMVLRLPFNLGIGGAVQAGFKYAYDAGYEHVVRLDGDGQHLVEETVQLLEAVLRDEADVAIGSRFLPGNKTYDPPVSRAIGIRWFAALISLLTRERVYDTTSGMQALNRKALMILAENYPQDYPEVEARILLHKSRLRVMEISARMEPRTTGLSSITYVRAVYYVFKVSMATLLAALRRESTALREGS